MRASHFGPLRVSSLSPVIVEDEYKQATEQGMAPLIGLALVLIVALLVLFTRTTSDMLLTLGGGSSWRSPVSSGRRDGSGPTAWD